MHRLILQPHRKHRLLIMLGDLLIVVASLSILLYLESGSPGLPTWSVPKLLALYVGVPAVTILVFYVFELHDPSIPQRAGITLFIICLGLAMATICYSALAYFLISLRPGKINLVLFALMTSASAFAWRQAFRKLVKIKPQRILFIGSDPVFDEIRRIVDGGYSGYYKIVSQWHQDENDVPIRPDLFPFVHEEGIDLVVYSLRSELVRRLANDLVTVSFNSRRIVDACTFYERLTYKSPLQFLDDLALLANANHEVFLPAIARNLKRAFDLFFALCLLPFALPVFLLAALAVKLNSRGPVLFVQERLGQNEVPFRLYKMRTMIDDAERLTGPQWSSRDDPRITRVGRILRKLRLDELPQLYNVLRGDMSVVGPRPIRKHFADILAGEIPYYRLRFLVKPGLTGWAQVNHDYAGSNAGQSEKQQYDVFYLIHQSFSLDLYIFFKTIRVMVRGRGT